MNDLQTFLTLIVIHFTFDWLLQPREIAKTKGPNNFGLLSVLIHCIINILPMTVFLLIILLGLGTYNNSLLIFTLLINLVSHFIIDAYLPKGETEREKINWTALDQVIHLVVLTLCVFAAKI